MYTAKYWPVRTMEEHATSIQHDETNCTKRNALTEHHSAFIVTEKKVMLKVDVLTAYKYITVEKNEELRRKYTVQLVSLFYSLSKSIISNKLIACFHQAVQYISVQ